MVICPLLHPPLLKSGPPGLRGWYVIYHVGGSNTVWAFRCRCWLRPCRQERLPHTHNMYCVDFSQDKLLPFQSGKGLTWSACYQVAGWSPWGMVACGRFSVAVGWTFSSGSSQVSLSEWVSRPVHPLLASPLLPLCQRWGGFWQAGRWLLADSRCLLGLVSSMVDALWWALTYDTCAIKTSLCAWSSRSIYVPLLQTPLTLMFQSPHRPLTNQPRHSPLPMGPYIFFYWTPFLSTKGNDQVHDLELCPSGGSQGYPQVGL